LSALAVAATIANIGGLGAGPYCRAAGRVRAAPASVVIRVHIVLSYSPSARYCWRLRRRRGRVASVSSGCRAREMRPASSRATAAFAGFAVTAFTAVVPSFLSQVIAIDNHRSRRRRRASAWRTSARLPTRRIEPPRARDGVVSMR